MESEKIGKNLWCCRGFFILGLMGCLSGIVPPACAQSTQYKEYPQNLGTYQPLVSPLVPSWMTLDIDLRARTEAQTAINYTDGNAQVYELTRIRGGVEVRPTKFLTGYIQFHDNHALGLPLKFVAANMRDSFDARQAFLEFHTKTLKVFAGRQELKFGGERLIGISDYTNNSRTFDGFDARIGDKNRVDIFSTSVVAIHPTSLDKHGAGLTFHGVYGNLGTIIPHTTVEPFVFVKALPRVLSQQSTYGTETEVTFGSEVVGNIEGGFDYDILGALQRGSYSNDSIHSGAAYVKVAYTAKDIDWKPRLGGEYDYATGNPHHNLNRISTFDELYPSNHNAFGLVDLFGYQNIKEVRINLDLTPVRHLTVLLQQEFLNAASVHDGVYNGGGTQFVKPLAAGFSSDDIGKGFDASAKYVFHNYLVVNIGVGHFFPGRLMTTNAHGAPLTLSYLSFTYRFKVNNK